ncbi:MAG: coiled coil domain-containing protein [Candidatus Rokubacteria bacterium]|nr:coiled coil domain-containing protein [Candidatus Rokubacteria bacterium]
MRTLAIALIAAATLASCNTVSGMKEDSRQTADYTYEKKEEYQRALVTQKRELDVKIDELKAKAGRASDAVKAEFARDMEVLDRQKAVLAQKTEAVKASSASAWNDVKAGANSAMDSVKQTYEKARARFQ